MVRYNYPNNLQFQIFKLNLIFLSNQSIVQEKIYCLLNGLNKSINYYESHYYIN